MPRMQPFLLGSDGVVSRGVRLARVHKRFDERFVQELLVDHPELLPVANLRQDIGELICIGREVPTSGSGTIDNLYLTTTGYLVVVETKLWRNPQSRREVLAQVLDYVKDIVTRDFEWLEAVWRQFSRDRGLAQRSLLEVMRQVSDEDLDEAEFVDRVQRVIERGDVIALIVGDGIETRLQELVAHVCRDSAHLRYSIGLVALRCYEMPGGESLLVLPELVQEVEPVERAYVRIEVGGEAAEQSRITSAVEQVAPRRPGGKRASLTEEEFFGSLAAAVGEREADCVRTFIAEVGEFGVEPVFKAAAVMLKVPDPAGERNGVSLLAFEKAGGIYNPDHGRSQVRRWGWSDAAVERVIGAYWRRLHEIDARFSIEGIVHMYTADFLPLHAVLPKLGEIREAIRQAVRDILREAEEGAGGPAESDEDRG